MADLGGARAGGAVFLVGHRTHSPATAVSYVAAGVAYYELDVRVTGDRIPVTHFRPVIGSRGLLERDNTRLRLSRSGRSDLRIEDVVGALPGTARIVFDPKDRELELRARLVTALAALMPDPSRHVVSSRSLRDIEMFGAAGFRTWWTLDTPQQLREVVRRPLPADGVTVRQRSLTADAVRSLHTVTDTVVAWTPRTVHRALDLLEYGVDGITTHSLPIMAALPH